MNSLSTQISFILFQMKRGEEKFKLLYKTKILIKRYENSDKDNFYFNLLLFFSEINDRNGNEIKHFEMKEGGNTCQITQKNFVILFFFIKC